MVERSCDHNDVAQTNVPIVVPAGKPLFVQQGVDTRGLAMSVFCVNAYFFDPEPDATYISEWTTNHVSCGVRLMKVREDGSKVDVTSTIRPAEPLMCDWDFFG